jgi:hypothetical protein
MHQPAPADVGQLAFNNVAMIVCAAEAGFGLGFVTKDQVAERLAERRLLRVLEDWRPPFTGYHLYYPSRRQPSAAFTLPVEAPAFSKRATVTENVSRCGAGVRRGRPLYRINRPKPSVRFRPAPVIAVRHCIAELGQLMIVGVYPNGTNG